MRTHFHIRAEKNLKLESVVKKYCCWCLEKLANANSSEVCAACAREQTRKISNLCSMRSKLDPRYLSLTIAFQCANKNISSRVFRIISFRCCARVQISTHGKPLRVACLYITAYFVASKTSPLPLHS